MKQYEKIPLPGIAYCTAPEGTKLTYGQEVLIYRRKGDCFITNKGSFQCIRFSLNAPALDVFEKPKVFKRKPFVESAFVGRLKSYKEAYYELLAMAKEAYYMGNTEQFCYKLSKQLQQQ